MLNWKEPSIYFESITKIRLSNRAHTHPPTEASSTRTSATRKRKVFSCTQTHTPKRLRFTDSFHVSKLTNAIHTHTHWSVFNSNTPATWKRTVFSCTQTHTHCSVFDLQIRFTYPNQRLRHKKDSLCSHQKRKDRAWILAPSLRTYFRVSHTHPESFHGRRDAVIALSNTINYY